MNPDDHVCLCFHVTRRKVVNYIRVEKPRRPSQLSQCFGAGTGCGWCRPYLERLLNDSLGDSLSASEPEKLPNDPKELDEKSAATSEMTFAEYKKARSTYVRQTGAKPPPGATPVEKLDDSEGS